MSEIRSRVGLARERLGLLGNLYADSSPGLSNVLYDIAQLLEPTPKTPVPTPPMTYEELTR
jgi:hypothetical protein